MAVVDFASFVASSSASVKFEIGKPEHVSRGGDYIAAETERVPQDLRSKLAQASRKLRRDFLADAVEDEHTILKEDADLVAAHALGIFRLMLEEPALAPGMKYMGDGRQSVWFANQSRKKHNSTGMAVGAPAAHEPGKITLADVERARQD